MAFQASRADHPTPILVVTDLDGTLLDHHNYSFTSVLPVIQRLQRLGAAIVANTSKTRSEWLAMRGDFANEDAFVVENGSAIIYPDGECRLLGTSRDAILTLLEELRADYQFQGFSDLSLEDVIAQTGLDPEAAQHACDREFSEPLIWQDTEEKKLQFCEALSQQNLTTLQGGRFLHVLGSTDKGKALDLLRDFYQPEMVVALGDSPNDIAMLKKADVSIAIASPQAPPLNIPEAIHSTQPGPLGWAETMTALLDKHFPHS